MRTLVTGAGGFVGRHLCRELVENDHTVYALEHPSSRGVDDAQETLYGDIRDSQYMKQAVASVKPEACIHLAAIAYVPDGNSDPSNMIAVNEGGTINLLEAVRETAPECKVLVISTAQIYGPSTGEKIIDEEYTFNPITVYAKSKANADLKALSYAADFDMHIMTARPHNHIGPGQSPDYVVPAFIKQAKAIASESMDPVIKVGNLESERDFTDVRDVVRAYRLIIEKGRPGNAYNIASDRLHKIGEVLDMILNIANVQPEIKVDSNLFRPTDHSARLDISKLTKDTMWHRAIDLKATLQDIFRDSAL